MKKGTGNMMTSEQIFANLEPWAIVFRKLETRKNAYDLVGLNFIQTDLEGQIFPADSMFKNNAKSHGKHWFKDASEWNYRSCNVRP